MVPTDELEGYGHRSRARKRIVLVVALAAVGAVIYLAGRSPPEQTAPEFELPLLEGGTLSSEELEGSPVVLNFFASWCAPCREEAPLLEETWRAYRDNGVRFVGVDVNDTRENARRFVREFDITYPVVVDSEDTLVRALDLYGLPQTFFIDHEWELLRVSEGEQTGEETRGVVPLGAISERQLRSNVELLLERMEDAR